MNYSREGAKNRLHELKYNYKPKLWNFAKVNSLTLALLTLFAIGFFSFNFVKGCYFGILHNTPQVTLSSLIPSKYSSTVYDISGNKIMELSTSDSNRKYANIGIIPMQTQKAFIAIEDARFYEHHGVDYLGMLRAGLTAVKTRSFSQGASTITQQLIKNAVFSNFSEEKSFREKLVRKLQEQKLAIDLENTTGVTKDSILELYLNSINLGAGTLGVQAASMKYFGKDVSELTLSESAVLAAIPKSPTKYNPITHPEDNKERRKKVLSDMLKNGFITDKEYIEASVDNPYTRIKDHNDLNAEDTQTYYEDALLNEVATDLVAKEGITKEQAYRQIYSGGLQIFSNLDPDVQKVCDEVTVSMNVTPQISATVMEPATGAVLAIVGGNSLSKNAMAFNRATDALRQPGSTFKILSTYAPALDNNTITLATIVKDEAYNYANGKPVHNYNNKYIGDVTIRTAIKNSMNVVAVKTITELGTDVAVNNLKAMGFTSLADTDQTQSIALGGLTYGVSTLELCGAYNIINNDGKYIKPHFYDKVLDHDGHTLLEHSVSYNQVLKQSTCYLLTSAMQDVIESGTGTAAKFEGTDIAGKTGTTSNNKDVWFAGFSKDYTMVTWCGYDNPKELNKEERLYAKELWRNVMQRLHRNKECKKFVKPSNIVELELCEDSGKIATSKCKNVHTEVFSSDNTPSSNCPMSHYVAPSAPAVPQLTPEQIQQILFIQALQAQQAQQAQQP